MATFQISPPQSFNFAQPDEWPRWIRRFERFREASGLKSKEQPSQVNTLVYCMGDKADDILSSLDLSDDDKKSYDTVKTKLEQHFVKRKNLIYERARFNQRRQEEGESVDSFVTSLHCLAEHCGYEGLKSEMIRDRIVVGLRDANLSMKLQMVADLNLEKAIAIARQSEAVRQQQGVVRGKDGIVDSMEARETGKKVQNKQFSRVQTPPSKPPQKQTCSRCGRFPAHSRQKCPANNETCHKCGKKGHYQSMCRTGKVAHVEVDSVDNSTHLEVEPDVFLGTLTTNSSSDTSGNHNPWEVTLQLNDKPVSFKIDTGAEVSVIPETVFKQLQGVTLNHAGRRLVGPGQNQLEVLGQFTAKLKYQNSAADEQIYVVRQLQKSLLGQPGILALDIVTRIQYLQEVDKFVIRFPKLFRGLGTIQGEYHISLQDGAKPFSLSTPRRVPLPLMPKVKLELQRMEELGVIKKVEQPTDWCAGIVVVPKSNGSLRICVDLTKLNASVRRERHVLPAVDQIVAQLSDAKVFTKLDANAGFWQIKLAKDSVLYTTFITPFGRFCFQRLPFGITSAPEFFQKKMSSILTDLKGVVCMIDDVLIYGSNYKEHDERLEAVLNRLQSAGVTLNKEKCQFRKTRVQFLGQLIDGHGVRPDPAKVKAIQQFKQPTTVKELRRFLGMANHLSKFMPNVAETTKCLRDLLSDKNHFTWNQAQQTAFDNIKQSLTSSPVLAICDPNKMTVVAADASSYGLGAVLSQIQSDGTCRQVAYASRALTSAEERYAQIEKESLAITWACERFSDYLIGKSFHVQTDHKPLVSLLSSKPLDALPVRIQRFRMRLLRFTYTISHIPGKELTIADALSRAPVSDPTSTDTQFDKEVEAYVNLVLESFPATEKQLKRIQEAQIDDAVCTQVRKYCEEGWPMKDAIPFAVKPYFQFSGDLNVQKGLLLKGSRIVIPTSMQLEMLDRVHDAHQGIHKCRQRAQQSIWWPQLSRQLADLVHNCSICTKERHQPPEPLMPSKFPELPWQKVGTDLFFWKNTCYLLLIDYYSRYIELAKLANESSSEVINHTKSIFARHGIPQEVISDNGPQYSSLQYKNFATEYGFLHTTSSPRFPQSNGEAERAVQTVKSLLKKAEDPYMAILIYRSTPLSSGFSPAELLMSRRLRTNLPIVQSQLQPSVPDLSLLKAKEEEGRKNQKRVFDSRHAVHDLHPLFPGEEVWVPDHNVTGHVIEPIAPRSYHISLPTGIVRRNRAHLRRMPTSNDREATLRIAEPSSFVSSQSNDPNRVTVTRSGRTSKPPNRFIDQST